MRTWSIGTRPTRTRPARTWPAGRPTALVLAALHAVALAGAVVGVTSYAGATALRPVLVFFLFVVGIFAVLWPGSAAGLVSLVGAVIAYVALTSLATVIEEAPSPSAARIVLIGGCLYVAHSADALRGAVTGADLDRSVLLRWLRRLAEALVPGLAVGAAVLGLRGGDGSSPIWLLGAVAVIAAAAAPALRVQRRPWRRRSTDDLPAAAAERTEARFAP